MKFEWKEYVKFIMLLNEYDIDRPHILAYHWMNVCAHARMTSENTLDKISTVSRFLWFSLEHDQNLKEWYYITLCAMCFVSYPYVVWCDIPAGTIRKA